MTVKREKATPPSAAVTTSDSTEQQKPEKKARDGLYVHSKGTPSKSIKVSCAACIAGHRSGDCNHYDRILLKIRAAGRPSQTCHHPPSCGGACLTPRAYLVPDEMPEWCTEHSRCIVNWEFSETSPPYPTATKQSKSKRKARSPTPVANDVSETTSSASNPAPAQSATKSCCSHQHKESWNQAIPQPHGPMYVPQMVMACHTPSILDGFANVPDLSAFGPMCSSNQSIAQDNMAFHQHTRSSLSSYVDPTLVSQAEPTNIGYTASAYLNNFPSNFTQPISHQSQRVDDAPPPTKRPCPGNGYQCPCEDDANCSCAKCFTHGRGFYEVSFAGMETSQPLLPPDFLLQEHSQSYDANNAASAPQFNESVAADDTRIGEGWFGLHEDAFGDDSYDLPIPAPDLEHDFPFI